MDGELFMDCHTKYIFYLFTGGEFVPYKGWEIFTKKIKRLNINLFEYFYYIVIILDKPSALVKKHYIASDKLLKAFQKYQIEKAWDKEESILNTQYKILSEKEDATVSKKTPMTEVAFFRKLVEEPACNQEKLKEIWDIVYIAYKSHNIFRDFLKKSPKTIEVLKHFFNKTLNTFKGSPFYGKKNTSRKIHTS